MSTMNRPWRSGMAHQRPPHNLPISSATGSTETGKHPLKHRGTSTAVASKRQHNDENAIPVNKSKHGGGLRSHASAGEVSKPQATAHVRQRHVLGDVTRVGRDRSNVVEQNRQPLVAKKEIQHLPSVQEKLAPEVSLKKHSNTSFDQDEEVSLPGKRHKPVPAIAISQRTETSIAEHTMRARAAINQRLKLTGSSRLAPATALAGSNLHASSSAAHLKAARVAALRLRARAAAPLVPASTASFATQAHTVNKVEEKTVTFDSSVYHEKEMDAASEHSTGSRSSSVYYSARSSTKLYSKVKPKVDTGLVRSSVKKSEVIKLKPTNSRVGSSVVPAVTTEHLLHEEKLRAEVSRVEPAVIPQIVVTTSSNMEVDHHTDLHVTHASTTQALTTCITSFEVDLDPKMASEYVDDIFHYMKQLEAETMPNPNYMSIQAEINWSMRTVLVNWLVEVHNTLNLLPETLYLTINLMDRFLSVKSVSSTRLQLVGITSLFVACKYEEVCVPSVGVMVYMTGNTYQQDDILKAETYLLGMLRFSISHPGPFSFLRRISKADAYAPNPRMLCKYLIEAVLPFQEMLGTAPSLLAAGAMYLARKILNNGDWTSEHVRYSGYSEEEVIPCAKSVFECLKDQERHKSIFAKYAEPQFLNASTFVDQFIKSLSH